MTEPIVTDDRGYSEENAMEAWNALEDVFQRPEVLEVRFEDFEVIIKMLSNALDSVFEQDMEKSTHLIRVTEGYYETLKYRDIESPYYEYFDKIIAAIKLLDNKMPKRFLKIMDDYFSHPNRKKEGEARKAKKQSTSVVYFLAESSRKAVKIGISTEVEYRIESIQACNPHPLILLNTIPGNHETERMWHKRFSSLRMFGEWFKLTPALIEAIENGSF